MLLYKYPFAIFIHRFLYHKTLNPKTILLHFPEVFNVTKQMLAHHNIHYLHQLQIKTDFFLMDGF